MLATCLKQVQHIVGKKKEYDGKQHFHLAPNVFQILYYYCGKNYGSTVKESDLFHVFPTDPEVHPQNESYWGNVNPIGPRACYDEGKRVAETMCYAYQKQVCSNILSNL